MSKLLYQTPINNLVCSMEQIAKTFESIKYNDHNLQNKLTEQLSFAENLIVDSIRSGGKIILTGVGKNVYACQKLAATMQSLNLPAVYLDVTHALHGDLGMISDNDIVLAFSKSGTTSELVNVMSYVKSNEQRFNCNIISINCSDGSSNVTNWFNAEINISGFSEIDNWNKVPTVSAIILQAIGDALALSVAGLIHDNFTISDFKVTHPGGTIGQKSN